MESKNRDFDCDKGILEMKSLREDYFKNEEKGNESVQNFLKSVDDQLLVQFLIGRKGKPDYAWETLKNFAKVKYEKYPELFPSKLPPDLYSLVECNAAFVLKSRDSLGRRVFVFDTRCWDVEKHSILDLLKCGTFVCQKLIQDEDCMRNGLIIVKDCSNLGIKHCSQYSIRAIQIYIAIFWNAFPIRFQGFYFVNAPKLLAWTMNLAKFCFPKKLAERIFVWTGEDSKHLLHQSISKEILPTFLGGDLESPDALDPLFNKNC